MSVAVHRIRKGSRALVGVFLLLLAACAYLEPETNLYAKQHGLRKGNSAAEKCPQEGTPKSVFIEARYIDGAELYHEMTARLRASIEDALREESFQFASSAAAADLSLSCAVRIRSDYAATSVLVTLATLTIFTPVWYPWTIDVEISDRLGQPVDSYIQHGVLKCDCFGVVIVPAAVAQGMIAVERECDELVQLAARTAVGKLQSTIAASR